MRHLRGVGISLSWLLAALAAPRVVTSAAPTIDVEMLVRGPDLQPIVNSPVKWIVDENDRMRKAFPFG